MLSCCVVTTGKERGRLGLIERDGWESSCRGVCCGESIVERRRGKRAVVDGV